MGLCSPVRFECVDFGCYRSCSYSGKIQMPHSEKQFIELPSLQKGLSRIRPPGFSSLVLLVLVYATLRCGIFLLLFCSAAW